MTTYTDFQDGVAKKNARNYTDLAAGFYVMKTAYEIGLFNIRNVSVFDCPSY